MKSPQTADQLVTEALDEANGGHLIDPGKRNKINTGTTPLHGNPAFPGGDYGKKTAATAYTGTYARAAKALKATGRITPQVVMQTLMQTVHQVVETESEHRYDLEQMAVALVLDLPEFADARQMYADGLLQIDAKLMPEMPPELDQANQDRVKPQEPTDEEKEETGYGLDPEIDKQLDAEVAKRKFVNLLIQGAAVNKMTAYHLVSDRLAEIDPGLLGLYEKMTALGDLAYWMKPDDAFGGAHGGQESIEMAKDDDENDVYVIHAMAINFPLLVHELVKGLYEVVAHNLVEDPSTRKHTYDQADTLAEEEWHIMHGPVMWAHLNKMVGQHNAHNLLPRILRHLCSLSPGPFSEISQEIFQGTERGQAWIKDTIADIRADMQEG